MLRVQIDWCLAAEVAPEILDQAQRGLEPRERERLAALAWPGPRRDFLIGRWLLRRALARATGRPAAGFGFEPGPHGRPQPIHAEFGPERPLPDLNLSHGGGLVVVALCDGATVGIDGESVARRLPARRLDRFLSAAEHADLLAADASDRQERFWRLWTLKEAYLKAIGSGITGSLGSFAIRLRDPAVPRLEGPDDAASWRIFEPALAPGFRAGLAVRPRAPVDVEVAVTRVP